MNKYELSQEELRAINGGEGPGPQPGPGPRP
jgi:hypothetical protein